MNVTEIIKSLREEPTEWKYSLERLLKKEAGYFVEKVMFARNIGITTYNGDHVHHIRELSLIDRLRLRWAIWRWRNRDKPIRWSNVVMWIGIVAFIIQACRHDTIIHAFIEGFTGK